MKMNNKVYDIIKWVVVVMLPASLTLYNVLAATWGWPYAEQISATISGVTVFLGSSMMISTYNYNKTK